MAGPFGRPSSPDAQAPAQFALARRARHRHRQPCGSRTGTRESSPAPRSCPSWPVRRQASPSRGPQPRLLSRQGPGQRRARGCDLERRDVSARSEPARAVHRHDRRRLPTRGASRSSRPTSPSCSSARTAARIRSSSPSIEDLVRAAWMISHQRGAIHESFLIVMKDSLTQMNGGPTMHGGIRQLALVQDQRRQGRRGRLFQAASRASCGSSAMAPSASSMSFTAICAATTSPSSSSTTTIPPRRVRCRASRPRPCPRSPSECWKRNTGLRSERAQLLDIVLAQLPESGLAGPRACPAPTCPGGNRSSNKVRKRANSTAVERFNRESQRLRHHSRRSIESLGPRRRSAAPWTSSAAPRDSSRIPAYEQLKHEFAEMGVSVSDYALVMDKYEFSMKDLLERGPGRGLLDQAVRCSRRCSRRTVFPIRSPPSSPAREDLERLASSRPRSTSEQRQRLREAIEPPPAGLRAAEADDVRGSNPHGAAVSARHRRRPEPAAPGQLRQRRPALSPRHQAGQHLRQARRHQGHRVCARATSASCRPSRSSTGRWTRPSTTCRSARCTSARRSRKSTSTWPTSRCTSMGTRCFSTSAIPSSTAASSRRATASSSAGTRRRIRHIIQDIIPGTPTDAYARADRRRAPIRSEMASRPRSSS